MAVTLHPGWRFTVTANTAFPTYLGTAEKGATLTDMSWYIPEIYVWLGSAWTRIYPQQYYRLWDVITIPDEGTSSDVTTDSSTTESNSIAMSIAL